MATETSESKKDDYLSKRVTMIDGKIDIPKENQAKIAKLRQAFQKFAACGLALASEEEVENGTLKDWLRAMQAAKDLAVTGFIFDHAKPHEVSKEDQERDCDTVRKEFVKELEEAMDDPAFSKEIAKELRATVKDL